MAGNCHSVVARKPQSLGSEVEKPTRKCHARIFPLHTEERLRVGGATKCRNQMGLAASRALRESSVCLQDLANNDVF